mgnify:CR=1 FL=1
MLGRVLCNDGNPGDDVWRASIPGQLAGTLIRYRITATGPTGHAMLN